MSLCLQDNYGNDITRHERNEMMKTSRLMMEKSRLMFSLFHFIISLQGGK